MKIWTLLFHLKDSRSYFKKKMSDKFSEHGTVVPHSRVNRILVCFNTI